MKKIATVLLMIIMMFSITNVAFAADDITVERNKIENVKSTSSTLLYDSGALTIVSYYRTTFSVPTAGYTTFIYAVNGINGNTNSVTVIVNNLDNGKTYVTDTFTPSSSARVKHATIPAGNYEVYIYGSGSYGYVLNFYQ